MTKTVLIDASSAILLYKSGWIVFSSLTHPQLTLGAARVMGIRHSHRPSGKYGAGGSIPMPTPMGAGRP